MSRGLSLIGLLGTVTFATACGSENGAAAMGGAAGTGGTAGTGGAAGASGAADGGGLALPACVSGASAKRCVPGGFPFAQFAVVNSDSCPPENTSCPPAETLGPGDSTASLSQPEGGKLCLSGTVKPGGYALLVLNYPKANEARTRILETLNAYQLGITSAAFTITSPPNQGVRVNGGTTKILECPNLGLCSNSGFYLMTGPDSREPVIITMPGPTIAPFANFRQTDPTQGDLDQAFDTKALQFLAFVPGEGPYDFCVSDFRFLDANRNEVKPNM